jgi:hypothetical protein
MSRYRSGYVRVDISDVVEEIQDEDILRECKSRGLFPLAGGLAPHQLRERLEDILQEIRAGRSTDALRRVDDLKEECLRLEASIARELQRGTLEIRK